MMNTERSVARRIQPQTVIEGAGVLLRRSIAPHPSNDFDPFLLFDHFAFNDAREGPLVGFPMHPHRGIETVTYMLEGSVHHRDSLGNSGLIGPGDVQWMTSGRGIMHEEMPRRGESGRVNGFQLWVNLPAALKMTTPRYQEVRAAEMPAVPVGGGEVRAVAGRIDGITGPVEEIAAAPLYADIHLPAGGTFAAEIPSDHTALAYLFEGQIAFEQGGEPERALQMLVLSGGDVVRATSPSGGRFLLIAGAPFGEPVVPYGPFVMNTAEEIQEALRDLRAGTFVR